MNKYEVNIATWNKLANLYENMFMNLDLYNESYDTLCNLLPQDNPNILEIGSGPGNITKYLLNKRPDFNILATDVAPTMVARTQKNNPSVAVQQLDCREISQLTQNFQAIISGFCIPYIDKEDCITFIKDSHDLLTSNGLLYLSFIEGVYDNSGYEKGSTGDQAFVHYYSTSFFKSILNTTQFNIVYNSVITFKRQDNEPQYHRIIIAQKK